MARRGDGIYLRTRRWRLATVVAVVALWAGSAPAASPVPRDDPYQFAQAVIWSLGNAHLAGTRGEDGAKTLEAQLVALRMAADDLRRAALVLEPFTASQDTVIREPAQLIKTAYLGLAQAHDQARADILRLLQEAIQTPGTGGEAHVRALDLMTAAEAEQRQLWLVMAQAVAVSTYALLEQPSKPDEPYKRLRLTARERTALLHELERSFGRTVMTSEKLVPGTSFAQGAGKAIHQFLSDTSWPSRDAK